MNAPKNQNALRDDYTGQALNFPAMVEQLAGMCIAKYGVDIGTAGAFGDPLTADDMAHALREIARVAEGFAARIETK